MKLFIKFKEDFPIIALIIFNFLHLHHFITFAYILLNFLIFIKPMCKIIEILIHLKFLDYYPN